jgi:hypothetical protein
MMPDAKDCGFFKDSKRGLIATVIAALCVFSVPAFIKFRSPVFFDFDEYYHLALALLIKKSGFPARLDWFSFSILGTPRYADSTPLLHALIIPFTFLTRNPVFAGDMAALFMAALLLAAAAFLYRRYGGGYCAAGLLIALAGSPAFLFMVASLRPATLATIFTLTGIYGMAEKKKGVVFFSCALFALGHISAFTMLMFAPLCEGLRKLRTGEFHYPTLLWTALGFCAGTLLHPDFPRNIYIVYVNALLSMYYVHADKTIFFGPELLPWNAASDMLYNIPLLAALGLVVFGPLRLSRLSHRTAFFWSASAVYAALALCAGRFWPQALVLAFMAVAAFHGDFLSGGGDIKRLFPAYGLWLMIAALSAGAVGLPQLAAMTVSRHAGLASVQEAALHVPEVVPPGELVYHPSWGESELLVYAAPANRYISALDPMFMYHTMPQTGRLYDLIYGGALRDPYPALTGLFRAHYGFIMRGEPFYENIRNDPRFVTLYENDAARIFKVLDYSAPSGAVKKNNN